MDWGHFWDYFSILMLMPHCYLPHMLEYLMMFFYTGSDMKKTLSPLIYLICISFRMSYNNRSWTEYVYFYSVLQHNYRVFFVVFLLAPYLRITKFYTKFISDQKSSVVIVWIGLKEPPTHLPHWPLTEFSKEGACISAALRLYFVSVYRLIQAKILEILQMWLT